MKKIKKFLNKLDQKAERIFNLKKHKYKVKLNLNSSSILGYYRHKNSKHTLVFNRVVYENVNFKDFKEVLIHEYSHYIANVLYGGRIQSHGSEWRAIMKVFGIKNPSAKTSSFLSIKKRESDVKVKCKCGERFISANKATRMRNGQKYICSKCKKKIKIEKKND